MLVSYNWLKELTDLNLTPAELAEKLNMSGAPIENITEIKPSFSGVITAKILKIDKHPDADKLSYCDVTDGKNTYKIVCGASNIKEGQTVPLAKIGAVLPGNFKIKKTKIRGIESHGMMCSAKELGMGSDHAGILILDPDKFVLGSEYKGPEPDTIFNLEITPNRPDLLCMARVARLVSAVTGCSLKLPSCELKPEYIDNSLDINKKLSVKIKDSDRCLRYTARIVSGIKVSPSPSWMQERLQNMGIRPINNVVDVTNYVLLELNQPLHAFDHKKIKNSEIIVRTAKKDEKILALDENEYKLAETDLVIADSKEPIAIGGVMGGKHFSVNPGTTDIVLESAYFQPSSVRKSSKSLKISSDSSYRFERGIDIHNVHTALNRAASLLAEIGGGKASSGIIDEFPGKPVQKPINTRFSRVNKVLGTELSHAEIEDIVKRLGFEIESRDDDSLNITAPGYRPDITSEIDIIEDVAQVYGYNNIPSTLPVSDISCGEEPEIDTLKKNISRILAGYGFSECVNYSFLNNKLLKELKNENYKPTDSPPLLNPLNEEETHMKTSLVPDLIKNLISNIRNDNENIHLFEVSSCYYMKDKGDFCQKPRAGVISYGYLIAPSYSKNEIISDIKYIKTVISGLFNSVNSDSRPEFSMHGTPAPFFEYSFDILINGKKAGIGGQLSTDIAYEYKLKNQGFIAELYLDTLLNSAAKTVTYKKISRFPVVKRDISLIVDEGVPSSRVEDAIKSGYENLIRGLTLYDLYKGEQVPDGKKSMTYSIIFRSGKKTLSEQEINKTMDKIIERLKNDIKAELRS